MDSNNFLLRQAELEEHQKINGMKFYPICILCLEAGEKVATYPKKETHQTHKRKEHTVMKAVGQAAKRAKKD